MKRLIFISLLLLVFTSPTLADVAYINNKPIDIISHINGVSNRSVFTVMNLPIERNLLTTNPETELMFGQFESPVGWSQLNCSSPVTINALHNTGSYGLTFSRNGGEGAATNIYYPGHGLNLSEYYNEDGSMIEGAPGLYIWLYIKDAATLAKIDNANGVWLMFWQPEGTYVNWLDDSTLTPGWNLIPFGNLYRYDNATLASANELDLCIDFDDSSVTLSYGDIIWDDVHRRPSYSTNPETALMTTQFESPIGWSQLNCSSPVTTNTQYKTGSYGLTFSRNGGEGPGTNIYYAGHGLDLHQYYNDNGSMKCGAPRLYIWLFIKDQTALDKIDRANNGVWLMFWQPEGTYVRWGSNFTLRTGWNLLPFGDLTRYDGATLDGATELDLCIDVTGSDVTLSNDDFIWDDLHSRPQ